MFDCETCPVRAWQARLSEADREALRIFALLRRPGVKTLRLEQAVWDALDWHGTRADALGLIERLALLSEHTSEKTQVPSGDDDGG